MAMVIGWNRDVEIVMQAKVLWYRLLFWNLGERMIGRRCVSIFCTTSFFSSFFPSSGPLSLVTGTGKVLCEQQLRLSLLPVFIYRTLERNLKHVNRGSRLRRVLISGYWHPPARASNPATDGA